MEHKGNICNISGAEVAPVDVIIGGSPCQDLSVAGKRAGLDGERSGLFMEQIRIIKEMRNATNGTSPRYMVWENVPGAFSSNKGNDFRIVLEETAKIADETAVVPRPDQGEWTNSGAIMGNGWSIAWRVFDAQFWGVPQRRRRIALVADFGGQSAPEILFERKGVSGYIAESGAAGQGVAGSVAGCFRETGVGYWGEGVGALRAQPDGSTGGNVVVAGFCQGASPAAQTIGYQEEVSPTIKGAPSGTAQVPAVFSFDSLSSNSMKSSNPHSGCRQVEIAKCIDTTNPDPSKNQGGMAVVQPPLIEMTSTKNTIIKDGICPTLTARMGTGGNQVNAVCMAHGQANAEVLEDKSPTLNCNHEQPIVAAVDCRNGTENPDINGTLQAKPNGGTSYNLQNTVRTNQSVRRLTPLECERLQGYERGWTDIPPQAEVTAEDLSFWREVWDEWDDMNGKKRHTDKQIVKWLQSESADSARYKALGNSIALPPWRFVLSRIHNQGARTMASLFDGIGGFPLIWQELGGQTLWASEVEPFPIAVTKHHFKEKTS